MRKEELYLKSPNHDVITIYIAKDSPIQNTFNLLKKEEPIVSNIKSRVTRQSIEIAFQKIKSFLQNVPSSDKGYIIVASATDFAWTNEILIRKDYYRCGKEFYSSPLEEELALKLYPIGIITLDTKEATIAHIGDRIEILKTMTSGVSGKHSKGGQSQRRFEREREQEIWNWFDRIAKAAKMFLESYPIEELVISGCGMTKNQFLNDKYLDYRLKEKVKIILDTQYTGEEGIRETLHKALPQLEKNAYAKEVKIVEDFFELLGKNIDSVVYGMDEVRKEIYHLRKLIKIEEITEEFPNFKGELICIRFKGEHYDRLRSLGGICGVKS